jgi:hypothetical protein
MLSLKPLSKSDKEQIGHYSLLRSRRVINFDFIQLFFTFKPPNLCVWPLLICVQLWHFQSIPIFARSFLKTHKTNFTTCWQIPVLGKVYWANLCILKARFTSCFLIVSLFKIWIFHKCRHYFHKENSWQAFSSNFFKILSTISVQEMWGNYLRSWMSFMTFVRDLSHPICRCFLRFVAYSLVTNLFGGIKTCCPEWRERVQTSNYYFLGGLLMNKSNFKFWLILWEILTIFLKWAFVIDNCFSP